MSTDTPTPQVDLLRPDTDADTGGCACGGNCACGGHDVAAEKSDVTPKAFTPTACGHSKFPPRD